MTHDSDTKNRMIDSFVVAPCHEEIDIIYEDSDLIIVNKPSGLLSLSGKNPLNKDSVHFRLVQQYPMATMVHRLDYGTSGIMVLALNKRTNAHLTKQFQARSVTKTYEAILLGKLKPQQGCINAPIAKAEFPFQKVCLSTGKPAQSNYQVIEYLKTTHANVDTTRVLYSPTTGRTHQLRIHSREIGHPIIGCDLYGLTLNGVNSTSMAERLMLHAKSIEFEHPINGGRVIFNGDKPDSMP